MNVRTQCGFTLWELMIAVAVAGIVLGLGVPSFKEFMRNSSMTSAANDLVAGVLLARAEAVKRQVPVTLCASPDPTASSPECDGSGSNGGFIVFVDDDDDGVSETSDGNAEVDTGEQVLLRREKPGGAINVWIEGGDYVSYGANGFKRHATSQANDSATRVLYCDDRGNKDRGGLSTARVVLIDWTGRAQVLTSPDDVSDAAGAISGADCP
ncbi:MAG TPA: GspH/FimT family pseudopilin [Gammaproteobacteria bacterium]|nr:GspH/FimT family pseudopilin [Gammaproteobacteria bacterium]